MPEEYLSKQSHNYHSYKLMKNNDLSGAAAPALTGFVFIDITVTHWLKHDIFMFVDFHCLFICLNDSLVFADVMC